MLMTRTGRGKTIYHSIAKGNDVDMLEYLDAIISVHFPEEKSVLLNDSENSPLSEASDFEIFVQLIKIGASDSNGENAGIIYDDLNKDQQEELCDLYSRKGWNIDFTEEVSVYEIPSP